MYCEPGRPSADPETVALIESTARAAGIERRPIPNEEIVDRCVYALVNEGARILEDGIALRAGDIDITYIYGYGFPPSGAAARWSMPIRLDSLQSLRASRSLRPTMAPAFGRRPLC